MSNKTLGNRVERAPNLAEELDLLEEGEVLAPPASDADENSQKPLPTSESA